MKSAIDQDIYRTIAYFSYFNYPLTAFEIRKWQLSSDYTHSLGEILSSLANLKRSRQVRNHSGFWGLQSKHSIEDQVHTRHERFLNAVQKYQKLRRLMRYLVRLPHVKGIAICNSLAFHFTESRSDIDLFVVTEPNRVWTTRLLAVTPLALLKQRPGEAKVDPIDLSFYVTQKSLDISKLRVASDDWYLALWSKNLLPIYGRPELWQAWQQNNTWVNRLVPNAVERRPSRVLRFAEHRRLPRLLSEARARQIQQKKFPAEIKEQANQDTRVVVQTDMLKFHKNDRREEIRTALKEKMSIWDKKS